MYKVIAFTIIALVFGAAFALVTPAFEVPDEVSHYWRATAAAYGHVVVGARVGLPRGHRVIIWALELVPHGERLTPERVRKAKGVMLQDEYRDPTPIAGLYSPATYVPQIAAAVVARVVKARPYFSFFAGRLATLVFCVVAIALICRAAPAFRMHFEAVALLPMALFLFGSWSADALTMVAGFLVSALLLRAIASGRAPARGELAAIVAAVAWLSLCKPPYVLIALLVLAAPVRRRFAALIVAVMIAGTLASSAMTLSGMEMPNPRYRPVDTRAQIRFIAAHPLHYVWVIGEDTHVNAKEYLESMTGRLGRYELKLPRWTTWLLWLMLLAAGVTCGPPLPPRARLLIWAIAIAIWLATLTYNYITSSIAGGDVVDGMQGRYILPMLPLLLTTLRIRAVRVELPAFAVYAVAVVANAMGIAVLVGNYY